jgi:hypothetical protein
MKYSGSEVFDNYTNIALEQGLISEADSNPRVGSDDLSAIELLYGVKYNKDEKDLMDQAHPEPVFIAPAYDILNGLVENNKERQKIIINILNTRPHAKLTNHRYAQKDLMEELIRLGFSLDNKDELDLMKLADSCAEGLQKVAILPLLGAIAAGLALIGAYNNFGNLSQGVPNDCDNVVEAIEKFSQEVPESSSELSELSDGIKYVKSLYEKAMQYSSNLKSIKHDNIIQGAIDINNSSTGQAAIKLLEKYKKSADILAKSIVKVYVPIIQTIEPAQDKSSSSIWTGVTDVWHGLFGSAKNDVLKFLVGSNIDMIGQGGLVGSLRKSVEQITAKENAMKNYVEQNKGSLVDYLNESADSDITPISTPEKSPEKKSLISELQEGEKP